MDWGTLLILGIGFCVWLFSALFKGAENAKKAMGQPGGPARPRPSATEIDRFLEEINRRRQQQQRRPVEAPPPRVEERPAPRTRAPAQRPRLTAQAPRPARREPERQRPVTAVLVEEPPAFTRVAPPPAPPEEMIQQQLETVALATTRPLPRRRTSAVQKAVAGLLRSKNGIRAAILVNEILGPPRCKRGPHQPRQA
jgi:hypothetical protein